MSYIVSIRRDSAPLSVAEVEAALRRDTSFTIEEAEIAGNLVAAWRPSPTARSEVFVYSEGVVSVTTPSDSALVKMQQIAKTFGASVTGEEGEDLTDVEVAPHSTAGGVVAGVVILVAIVAGLVWLIS